MKEDKGYRKFSSKLGRLFGALLLVFALIDGILFYALLRGLLGDVFSIARRHYANNIARRLEERLDEYRTMGSSLLDLRDVHLLQAPWQVRLALAEFNLRFPEVECSYWLGEDGIVSSCPDRAVPSLHCEGPTCARIDRKDERSLVWLLIKGRGGDLLLRLPMYGLWAYWGHLLVPTPYFDVSITDAGGRCVYDSRGGEDSCAGIREKAIDRARIESMDWTLVIIPRFAYWLRRWGRFFGWMLAIQILILGVVAGISVWIVKRSFRDLEEIIPFVDRISKGDFQARLTLRRDDEIGLLARHVNGMVAELQEYRRLSNIWLIGKAMTWLAHEIKNKILPAKAFLQGVMEGRLEKDFLEKMGRVALDQIEKTESLLEDFSNLRMDLQLHLVEVDICALVQEVVRGFQPLIVKKGIDVEVSCTPELKWVVDGDKFSIALGNLLLNALEVLGPGGKVDIRARVRGDVLLMEVEDNGPGIPEEVKSHLFEPFTREGRERSPNRGVGLAIVYNIVKAHGGSIAVESSSEGTKFVIKIPRSAIRR